MCKERAEQTIEKFGLPGISMALHWPGGQITSITAGARRIHSGKPVTAETQYRAGSLTKLVTALGWLKVMQQGRVHLDQLLSGIMPIAKEQKITIRQLLTHRAGLIRGPYLNDVSAEAYGTVSVPGTMYKYSNLAFDLAARSLEYAAEQKYQTYIRDKVLLACGAHNSFFENQRTTDAEIATGYQSRAYREIPGRADVLKQAPDRPLGLGSAGLWTTPTDYCRLLKTFQKAIPAEFKAVSTSHASAWVPGAAVSELFGQRCLYLTGGHFGFSSYAVLFQTLGLAGVVMTNRSSSIRALQLLLHHVLADACAAVTGDPVQRKQPSLASFAEIYYSASGQRVKISLMGSELLFSTPRFQGPLTQIGACTFYAQRDADCRILLRFLVRKGAITGVFTDKTYFGAGRAALLPDRPPESFRKYVGAYHSPVTGTAEIFSFQDHLRFRFCELDENPLAVHGAVFIHDGGPFTLEPLHFYGNGAGSIAGFETGGMSFSRTGGSQDSFTEYFA
jgi:CubicO group peptidase (beta-lactamase class C family)